MPNTSPWDVPSGTDVYDLSVLMSPSALYAMALHSGTVASWPLVKFAERRLIDIAGHPDSDALVFGRTSIEAYCFILDNLPPKDRKGLEPRFVNVKRCTGLALSKEDVRTLFSHASLDEECVSVLEGLWREVGDETAVLDAAAEVLLYRVKDSTLDVFLGVEDMPAGELSDATQNSAVESAETEKEAHGGGGAAGAGVVADLTEKATGGNPQHAATTDSPSAHDEKHVQPWNWSLPSLPAFSSQIQLSFLPQKVPSLAIQLPSLRLMPSLQITSTFPRLYVPFLPYLHNPSPASPLDRRTRILAAVEAQDIPKLRAFALEPGGLIDAEVRSRAWLVLCGIQVPVTLPASIRGDELDAQDSDVDRRECDSIEDPPSEAQELLDVVDIHMEKIEVVKEEILERCTPADHAAGTPPLDSPTNNNSQVPKVTDIDDTKGDRPEEGVPEAQFTPIAIPLDHQSSDDPEVSQMLGTVDIQMDKVDGVGESILEQQQGRDDARSSHSGREQQALDQQSASHPASTLTNDRFTPRFGSLHVNVENVVQREGTAGMSDDILSPPPPSTPPSPPPPLSSPPPPPLVELFEETKVDDDEPWEVAEEGLESGGEVWSEARVAGSDTGQDVSPITSQGVLLEPDVVVESSPGHDGTLPKAGLFGTKSGKARHDGEEHGGALTPHFREEEQRGHLAGSAWTMVTHLPKDTTDQHLTALADSTVPPDTPTRPPSPPSDPFLHPLLSIPMSSYADAQLAHLVWEDGAAADGGLPTVRDAPQVLADARRGFAQWATLPSPAPPLRRLLHLHLSLVLHARPHLHYYQGLHSLASLPIVLFADPLPALALTLYLVDAFVADHALRSFRGTLAHLDLVLPCIFLADPPLHAALQRAKQGGWPGPHSAVPWVVAMFAHDAAERVWVERVWDALVAHTGPAGVVWAAVGVLVARRGEILNVVDPPPRPVPPPGAHPDDSDWDQGFDPSALHKVLSRDPSQDTDADVVAQFAARMVRTHSPAWVVAYTRPGGAYDAEVARQGFDVDPRVPLAKASAVVRWTPPNGTQSWDPAKGMESSKGACEEMDKFYASVDVDRIAKGGKGRSEEDAKRYAGWWFSEQRYAAVGKVAVGVGVAGMVVGIVAWGAGMYMQGKVGV
ncbi:hypothetical protein M427DRAFT_75276 [Gonapodya prolifera JEL478]|uniref:Rab-GAP TBC domain-containing protein n=1 Tax=Gonapodya prolifera (strain JEL478) TaxID=1344416 RepID=A0A138ZZK2_GONPJ|nr:hypothetical protein M427DRAFT_75276 [Gonapodya prolifera JEL478]|eukprot:KXS09563.1 hypothetical protein M427DRAFT_75276 [Gonapodya prolifera JEL478]